MRTLLGRLKKTRIHQLTSARARATLLNYLKTQALSAKSGLAAEVHFR